MGRQHDQVVAFMIRRADWVNKMWNGLRELEQLPDGHERFMKTAKELSEELEELRREAEAYVEFPQNDVSLCFWIRWARLKSELDDTHKRLETRPELTVQLSYIFDIILLFVGRLTLISSDEKFEIDTYAERKEQMIIDKAAEFKAPMPIENPHRRLRMSLLRDTWFRHYAAVNGCECFMCKDRRLPKKGK